MAKAGAKEQINNHLFVFICLSITGEKYLKVEYTSHVEESHLKVSSLQVE